MRDLWRGALASADLLAHSLFKGFQAYAALSVFENTATGESRKVLGCNVNRRLELLPPRCTLQQEICSFRVCYSQPAVSKL